MNKDLPKRKSTRLKGADYSNIGSYFITICVKDRQPILSDITLEKCYDLSCENSCTKPCVRLTPMGKKVEEYLLSCEKISGIHIDRYVIMPDHIHLIIVLTNRHNVYAGDRVVEAPTPTNAESNAILPRVISAFKRLCTKEIGYNIFQRGYYDHIIRDKEDYETRTKYIHENPLKWYYEHR